MLLRPLKHLFRFSKGELETLQVPVLWMLKCFYLLEHGWLGQARVIYGCIWAEFACFIFRWMCVHEPDHWRSFVPSPGCGSFSHFCQEGPVFCPPPLFCRTLFICGRWHRYWRQHWFQGSVSSKPDCNFPDTSSQHNTGRIIHSLGQRFL